MNNIIRNIATAITLISLCASCVEDIDLDLSSTEQRLVVEAFITTDTTYQQVKLTLSGDYFDNQPMPAVSKAKVTISTDDQIVELVESEITPGVYVTPTEFYGRNGKTYHLSINNVDINKDGVQETYTADSYLPRVLYGDSIALDYNNTWKVWQILLFAKDPQDEINFYMFRALLNDQLLTETLSSTEIADDEFFDGNDINGVWVYGWDNDDDRMVTRDKVTLEMCTINEVFFEYLAALDEETEAKNPLFSGAPANVPGNISNNALGIFTTYGVSRLSVLSKKNLEDY